MPLGHPRQCCLCFVFWKTCWRKSLDWCAITEQDKCSTFHSKFVCEDLWCLTAQLESLKLFSTAERLGLLSALERLLVSDPAAISSIALPLFVASLGANPPPLPFSFFMLRVINNAVADLV